MKPAVSPLWLPIGIPHADHKALQPNKATSHGFGEHLPIPKLRPIPSHIHLPCAASAGTRCPAG